MGVRTISRNRGAIAGMALVLALAASALACQPAAKIVEVEKLQTVVVEKQVEVTRVETVVVEKPVEVTRVETVVVEKQVPQEVVRVETVVVEKQVQTIVEVIATPVPAATVELKPIRGGIVRAYQPGYTGVLVPFLTKAPTARYYMFDPLVEYDDRGELRPNLASTWDIAPDSKSITFNLRSDVKWHDGVPFTAQDVVFTMDTIMDPNTVTKYRSQMTIGGVPIVWTAVDDRTVRMDMPEPFAPVMGTLSEVEMVPRHVLEGTADINTDPFNMAPIGTGPFRVLEVVADSHIDTQAVPAYHNGVPYLDKVFHLFFPDPDAAAAALLTDQIDSMWAYPEQQAQFERPGSDKVVRTYAYWLAITIGFNQAHPALADERVREAIRWGIKSKEEWTDVVTRGRGEPANVFMAIASPLNQYNPPGGLPSSTNDQAKAKQLLEGAGWTVGADGIRAKDGSRLSLASPWINYLIEYGEGNEILQANLREIGIELKPKPVDSSLRRDLENNSANGWDEYAMEIQEWPHGISAFEPDMMAELACTAFPPAGNNYMNYCNPAVDQLLVQGRSTFDPAQRQAAYRQIQQLMYEDVAAVPLYFVFDALVTTSRIQGIPQDSPSARHFYWKFAEKIWVSR